MDGGDFRHIKMDGGDLRATTSIMLVEQTTTPRAIRVETEGGGHTGCQDNAHGGIRKSRELRFRKDPEVGAIGYQGERFLVDVFFVSNSNEGS